MFGLGMGELLVILAVVILIFGAKKLPQIGAGLGQGIQNFRKAVKGEEESPPPPASQPSQPDLLEDRPQAEAPPAGEAAQAKTKEG
ncbi:MAG: twin-arginine translocase TatA/TatE family subunit [Nitrospirae bacterium]|nr:MAG: twin-arginine translocase TatA/TatE family subunit [Nitrospirota bacterium]